MTRHEYVKSVLEPRFKSEDELYHHGILGMKWGVRRYQNEDGSLTPEGERRYYQDDKGKFVKRNIYELKEYDRKIEKERQWEEDKKNELANNAPAKDWRDFVDRMNTRLSADDEMHNLYEQMIDLDQKRYEAQITANNELKNDNINYDKWGKYTKEADDAYNQMIKVEDKLRNNLMKYKAPDMRNDEVQTYIDSLYEW